MRPLAVSPSVTIEARVTVRIYTENSNRRCFLSISYPQPIVRKANGDETHLRPQNPISGAGHDSLRASV